MTHPFFAITCAMHHTIRIPVYDPGRSTKSTELGIPYLSHIFLQEMIMSLRGSATSIVSNKSSDSQEQWPDDLSESITSTGSRMVNYRLDDR